ncbi:MAG TPA: hypothetical protein VG253_25830 [Streptosporangiaceae bacterium]|nr:hypothetical protein [Streptosporangiaceae bacterium]
MTGAGRPLEDKNQTQSAERVVASHRWQQLAPSTSPESGNDGSGRRVHAGQVGQRGRQLVLELVRARRLVHLARPLVVEVLATDPYALSVRGPLSARRIPLTDITAVGISSNGRDWAPLIVTAQRRRHVIWAIKRSQYARPDRRPEADEAATFERLIDALDRAFREW